MSRSGPIVTLAAGAVLAAALGVVSVAASPPIRRAGAEAAVTERPAAAKTGEQESTAQQDTAPQDTAQQDTAQQDTAGTVTVTSTARPEDTTPPRADYAGVAQGNGGLVAIAVRNGKAVAYFCDGRIESWLKGAARDGTVVLKGRKSLITAALTGGRARGTVQVGDAKWRFTAPTVRKPSGLYRASAVVRGAKIVGGWIVLPDGQEVGRVSIGGSGEPAPAFVPGTPVDYYGVPLRPADPDAFIDDLTP